MQSRLLKSATMSPEKPLTPAQLCRRHRIEILIAGIVYVAVLFASIQLIKLGVSKPLRIALALSPMVPAAFLVLSVFRNITRMDELQRRIHTESFALSAAGTAFLGLTYTFLQGDAGFPPLDAGWAWTCIAVIYMIANLVLRRRYS